MRSIAIATVTYNSLPLLREFFPRLSEVAAELGARLVVVDNASADGSADFAAERAGEDLILRRNEANRGYAAAVNQAFAAVPGSDVLLLNPDVALADSGPVEAMERFLTERPSVGVVAPALRGKDGAVQASARPFPSVPAMAGNSSWLRQVGVTRRAAEAYLRRPPPDRPTRVDWAIGAAMLIRRSAFEEVGGWDERFFLYLEDTDFCLRCARRGWETWYLPEVTLPHLHPRESDPSHGSVLSSTARRQHVRSALRFFRRYPRLAFRAL